MYQAIQFLILIVHFLLYFPDLLYQALKSSLKLLTHPFAELVSNIAKTSKHDPQNSDEEIATSPIPYAIASLQPCNEFDIGNLVWKEECDQITYYSRRLQAPQRHVRERWELDGGLLDEDIIRLRELEGKAWGAGSEVGD